MEGAPRKKYRGKRPFKKSAPKIEDRIRDFVIRNSRNGFFTRVQTVATKFGISKDEAWSLAGTLLADNSIECVHSRDGEAKLCEIDCSVEIMSKERQRRKMSRESKS